MNIDKINDYIMECLDVTPYFDEDVTMTDSEKLQFLYDTFKQEYWYKENKERYRTINNAFVEYLRGLPTIFTVDFTNYDIWNKAVELELLPNDPTDKQIENFLPGWFKIIGFRTFVLMRKHGVNTND